MRACRQRVVAKERQFGYAATWNLWLVIASARSDTTGQREERNRRERGSAGEIGLNCLLAGRGRDTLSSVALARHALVPRLPPRHGSHGHSTEEKSSRPAASRAGGGIARDSGICRYGRYFWWGRHELVNDPALARKPKKKCGDRRICMRLSLASS